MKKEDFFSKCGYDCLRCPSYKKNIKTVEDRRRCSEGWHRYHGFRLTASKIRPCDGCQTPDEKKPLLYVSCRVRKCAGRNGVRTCAHCSAFPCEDVNQVGNVAGLLDRAQDRLGAAVPEEDYAAFIEPYEGIKHLNQLRASLGPQDVKVMKPVSLKARVFDCPERLCFSRDKTAAYFALHRLVEDLNRISGVSFARKEALHLRKKHLLKILWGFGLGGRFDPEDKNLVLDSKTYRSFKLLSYPFDRVVGLFAAFAEYGVLCRFVPLEDKGWLTPTGALRTGRWQVRMSFGEKRGGTNTLVSLIDYAQALQKKFGGDSFKHFGRADMRWLESAS